MLSRSPKAYLAFDLGAESGRAVLAHLHSGILTINEVHRFPNEPVTYGDSVHWDVSRLWFEMRTALSALEVSQLAGIGVDTWGVDYALLGERASCIRRIIPEPGNIACNGESGQRPGRNYANRPSNSCHQYAESLWRPRANGQRLYRPPIVADSPDLSTNGSTACTV